MSRRFALAPVLRMREIAVDQERRFLGQILSQLTALRQQKTRLDGEIARTGSVREQGLAATMAAAHLRSSYGCVDELRHARAQVEAEISRLETARAAQILACEVAYREHELLCALRDTQQAEWQSLQNRAEQRQADAVFLQRWRN